MNGSNVERVVDFNHRPEKGNPMVCASPEHDGLAVVVPRMNALLQRSTLPKKVVMVDEMDDGSFRFRLFEYSGHHMDMKVLKDKKILASRLSATVMSEVFPTGSSEEIPVYMNRPSGDPTMVRELAWIHPITLKDADVRGNKVVFRFNPI